MKSYAIITLAVAAVSLGACNCNNTEGETVNQVSEVEPDGRVVCYNDDGSVFFDALGSYVNMLNDGTAKFRHMKNHPDHSKGMISFSPKWKCMVEDW